MAGDRVHSDGSYAETDLLKGVHDTQERGARIELKKQGNCEVKRTAGIRRQWGY